MWRRILIWVVVVRPAIRRRRRPRPARTINSSTTYESKWVAMAEKYSMQTKTTNRGVLILAGLALARSAKPVIVPILFLYFAALAACGYIDSGALAYQTDPKTGLQTRHATDVLVSVKAARYDGQMAVKEVVLGSGRQPSEFFGTRRNLVLDVSLTNNGLRQRDTHWDCVIRDFRGREITEGPPAPSTTRGVTIGFIVEYSSTREVELTFGIPDDLIEPYQLDCGPGVWATFDLPPMP